MARTIQAVFRHVLLAAALLGFAGQVFAEEYYYAIEVNGVLCGYARLATSPLREGTRDLTLLSHDIVVRGTLLGGAVDNRMTFVYHLDPATAAFTFHSSAIEQGSSRMTSAIRIAGPTARLIDEATGGETVIELPDGVVLANTLFHPHLVADFVGQKAGRKVYLIFDGRDNAVREAVYTRTGTESLRLAGRTFDTVVLNLVDRSTGVNATVWLDTKTGIIVQTLNPGNRRTHLAEASVVEAVANASSPADLTSSIMSRTNVAIPNVRAISYMKVRAAAQPTGAWLTPDALNVPGQRFTGSVKDNLIEGVFEIEHGRYGGAKAPPFPPDFSGDAALGEYLRADGMIQSDDPVLAATAREITRGSRDSWEAARRLSAWVSQNIEGAIPGGVTARGTYDQRAGECGGHSFLLAAFCRSVGIPARAVWWCMYTPHNAGAFGQHAWNEVYMGEAGWIPLDTTASETDYVDSGHIRMGVFQSVATTLNARSMEILDHRVSPVGEPAGNSGAREMRLDAYVGEYTNAARGNVVRVFDKAGALTLEVPGNIVLSFKEPASDGVWRSTLSDQIFATFQLNDSGRAVEMRLHQVLRLRRTGSPATPAADVPEDLGAYPGTYLLAQARAEFTIAVENRGLVLHDPLAGKAVALKAAGKPGTWEDDAGRVTIWFEQDQPGRVTAMLIDGATIFRR